MKAIDWIVDYLIRQGVTDAFGIPGAVILDLLYAMEKRKPEITSHLVYHEQGGAYAACGYSQASRKLGMAYGTRGPGFTNMLTAIADAYYDSLPVLFLTAHSVPDLNQKMRVLTNQEMDTVWVVKKFTKYAFRVSTLKELNNGLREACAKAQSDRKGPVFLDIYSGLFDREVDGFADSEPEESGHKKDENNIVLAVDSIIEHINKSKRPVILVGNGLRDINLTNELNVFAEYANVPILSSRTAQDIMSFSSRYYGHIGSHGTRYSNFILSKSDLLISLGNRMAVSTTSKSFSPIFNNAKTIRIDIDKSEFRRKIPNSLTFEADLRGVIPSLVRHIECLVPHIEWLQICERLKTTLDRYDENDVVKDIMQIMNIAKNDVIFVCDVGNHGFWVTNAYSYTKRVNRILYSGSFGVLGNAIPKAIGAYYVYKSQIICFVGDQGLQMNSQELEFIGRERIPVTIVVLNNHSSGMIKEREDKRYNSEHIHTTLNSGYSVPDLRKLAGAYGLRYINYHESIRVGNEPCIIEIEYDDQLELCPYLPVGSECQNLYPPIEKSLYNKMNTL